MTDGLLEGFRALDLTDEKGFACGKILASMGVDTIKIERPGGDPGRKIPPVYNESSLYWYAFNTDKRSITLDLETSQGRELFLKLVKTADFLLESFPPGYMDRLGLGYEALSKVNPRIIMTSITSFGQKGPYSQYKGCELVVSAMSGVLVNLGDPDRPPVKEALDSCTYHANVAAALGTLISHYYRELTGEGQQVDVSIQEVAATRNIVSLIAWEFDKRPTKRSGPIYQFGTFAIRAVWPCKDGHLFWTLITGPFAASANRALSQWIDEDGIENPLGEVSKWEEVDLPSVPKETIEAWQRAIGEFFLKHTKKELAEEGVKRGINACVANNVIDVFQHEHLRSRDFWVDLGHPDLGIKLSYPKHFFLCSETENYVRRRPPLVGEDNEAIFGKEMGLSREVAGLKEARVKVRKNEGKQALDGVKILDFTWWGAGTYIGKNLGDYGAQVIKIESITRPDLTRTTRMVSVSKATNPDDKPWFTSVNTSKYSIALNLKRSRAREVIHKLIRWADVVLENFTPGTMSKLSYDYEYVRKIKPDIIMASASVYGQTGPLSREWGMDGIGAAVSGRLDLSGWPDREPATFGIYGDYVLPMFLALAVVSALDYRHRTGKGQYIDGSMFEISAQQISPALLDSQANGRLQTRTGNRTFNAAPHGVFPCVGEDRWCAIGVFTVEEWKSLCHAIGDPLWTKQESFATLASRKENEDELEELVAEWTNRHTAEEVMHIMQAAGVSAGVVQNAQDILEHDPQLREREFFVPVKHPVLGVFGHQTPPYKLSKIKSQVRTSPCLGEHTDYICTQLLGMSDEEFTDLLQEGIFE